MIANGARYRFAPEGVEVKGARGQSLLEWRAFTRAERTLETCLLHTFGGQLVYIIPRRDFASPELEETFHRLLRTKLGDAALR
jgi:hypothetical protein